jgi:hypothetical protein
MELKVPLGTPHRAWRTLPWRYFEIQPSLLTGAGLGVFTRTFIEQNTWLGEYDGEILQIVPEDEEDTIDLTYAWEVGTKRIVTNSTSLNDHLKFNVP